MGLRRRPRGLALGLALAALSWSRPVAAEAPPAAKDAGVLPQLSTEAVLDLAQGYFNQAVERQKKQKAASDLEAQQLTSLGKRIYIGTNLSPLFSQAYTKAVRTGDSAAVLSWLGTPAGVKLRQGLSAALKLPAKERTAYYAANSKAKLTHNRRNALATYGKAWLQSDFYAAYQHGMDLAVLLALSPADGPPARQLAKDVRQRLQKDRSYDQLGQDYFKDFDFYVTKDMQDDEIDELSQFAATLPGSAHVKAYLQALSSTLDSAALTLQRQFKKAERKPADAKP